MDSTYTNTVPILLCKNVAVKYDGIAAVKVSYLEILRKRVTAFIGSSGCGKSSLLRCFNRLNDLIPTFSLEGLIEYDRNNLYAKDVDPVMVARKIGMVFQKPNPFPKSIYDNIAYGLKIHGTRNKKVIREKVEESLRKAALWTEVKDILNRDAKALSGGQQQRLCIARAVALKPQVLLLDEPCSALDPISNMKIEELIHTLKEEFTIVIVTHNMQQASRVSDYVGYFHVTETKEKRKLGYLAEYGATKPFFNKPETPEATAYVTGSMG